ncbi:hypothetical protein [Candidatus Similichlamydia epinepheli]|uniref:hypothetical protein n=1 Tax=Candidatus Similichlamydia epinepheli TaxID=1903953 RepID=UPI000D3CFFF7|nr:hypothetical protein [Candidatus Similichlamydia epinepheli]
MPSQKDQSHLQSRQSPKHEDYTVSLQEVNLFDPFTSLDQNEASVKNCYKFNLDTLTDRVEYNASLLAELPKDSISLGERKNRSTLELLHLLSPDWAERDLITIWEEKEKLKRSSQKINDLFKRVTLLIARHDKALSAPILKAQINEKGSLQILHWITKSTQPKAQNLLLRSICQIITFSKHSARKRTKPIKRKKKGVLNEDYIQEHIPQISFCLTQLRIKKNKKKISKKIKRLKRLERLGSVESSE